MKKKKKEGKRNIVFKEQDKILEEKRKNMAEIANLKLNLKQATAKEEGNNFALGKTGKTLKLKFLAEQ